MTTKEKAKAYDEALERAKKMLASKRSVMVGKQALETIFPELSETEDERIRKWIFGIIKNIGDPADKDAEKELEEMQPLALAWLKKQKEQKPVEWSEEDEEKLERVIWYVEKGCSMIFQKSDELVSWLESLRPRLHWRPSEEQMKALLNAEGYLRAGDQFDSAKSIAELYEQLKKL